MCACKRARTSEEAQADGLLHDGVFVICSTGRHHE